MNLYLFFMLHIRAKYLKSPIMSEYNFKLIKLLKKCSDNWDLYLTTAWMMSISGTHWIRKVYKPMHWPDDMMTWWYALFIKNGTLIIPSTVLFTCMQFHRFFSASNKYPYMTSDFQNYKHNIKSKSELVVSISFEKYQSIYLSVCLSVNTDKAYIQSTAELDLMSE